jgi:hypothetical protein
LQHKPLSRAPLGISVVMLKAATTGMFTRMKTFRTTSGAVKILRVMHASALLARPHPTRTKRASKRVRVTSISKRH